MATIEEQSNKDIGQLAMTGMIFGIDPRRFGVMLNQEAPDAPMELQIDPATFNPKGLLDSVTPQIVETINIFNAAMDKEGIKYDPKQGYTPQIARQIAAEINELKKVEVSGIPVYEALKDSNHEEHDTVVNILKADDKFPEAIRENPQLLVNLIEGDKGTKPVLSLFSTVHTDIGQKKYQHVYVSAPGPGGPAPAPPDSRHNAG